MAINKIDITKIDFQYYPQFEVDYDYSHNCKSMGCDKEGICRCGIMEDVHLRSDIDLTVVTDSVYNHIFGNVNDIAIKRENTINSIIEDFDMNKYFINRLLTHYRIYDKGNWDIEYGGGYYGDELYSVKMDMNNQLNEDLLMLFSDNKSKIELLLTREYRYVDTRLSNKEWDLDVIDKKDIEFGQKEHYNNITQGLVYYSDTGYDKELPRGILRKDGTKYRVMDGYHRMKNTQDDFIIALVAY